MKNISFLFLLFTLLFCSCAKEDSSQSIIINEQADLLITLGKSVDIRSDIPLVDTDCF